MPGPCSVEVKRPARDAHICVQQRLRKRGASSQCFHGMIHITRTLCIWHLFELENLCQDLTRVFPAVFSVTPDQVCSHINRSIDLPSRRLNWTQMIRDCSTCGYTCGCRGWLTWRRRRVADCYWRFLWPVTERTIDIACFQFVLKGSWSMMQDQHCLSCSFDKGPDLHAPRLSKSHTRIQFRTPALTLSPWWQG